MPTSASPGPLDSATWRRLAVPLIALVAAAAGFGAGRLVDAPGSALPLSLLVLTVAVAAGAALLMVRPGPDRLRSIGLDALRSELDRARRHRRSFAMARFGLADPAPTSEVSDTASDGIAEATVRLIGASLRITDHVWLDGRDAVILLPESDRATAEAFAERVRATAPDRFVGRTGIAAFPDDGLTSGALLDALERDMLGDPVPSPMVRTTVAGMAGEGGASATLAVGDHAESGIG